MRLNGTLDSIGSGRRGVSVVVPAFNEGLSIEAVLERVLATTAELGARYDVETIVVDDGSSDETAEILARLAERSPGAFRIATHERNRGLEAAITTGVRSARAPVVVLLDADLSYAPDIVEPLVRKLEESGAGAALASPYMPGGRVANVPKMRLVASRVANWLLAFCVGRTLHTFTGMVRAYDREALLPILAAPAAGEFNTWIVAELLAAGCPVVEIPAALVWPRERYESASRLTLAALRKRSRQVLTSIVALRRGYLTFAKKRAGKLED